MELKRAGRYADGVLLGINIRTHDKLKCAATFLMTNALLEVNWRRRTCNFLDVTLSDRY